MATIKHTLQRELFLPNDERLIGLCCVFKAPKRKKGSFLCAVLNTADSPQQARIYQVKKADKGDSYKKKLSWLLRDLRAVDGKDPNKETAEFDLHFEKIYKWVASSVQEKESFLGSLWRLSQRHLIQKPDFINVPEHLMKDIPPLQDQTQSTQAGDEISLSDEDYHALSAKEESDLSQLMSEMQDAITNCEAFVEQLSKQLSVLDGANIYSIMGSEDQLLNLMRLLDDGISRAESIENRLNSYEAILQNVKEQMEVMKDKDTLMRIRNENHQSLLEELGGLVTQLDLGLNHMEALLNGDLATQQGIRDCTVAAQALFQCMTAKIHPALMKMSAVEDQRRRFKKLSQNFSDRLVHFLNNLFIHQGNELSTTLGRQGVEVKMPSHTNAQRQLVVYSDLMLWLKNTDYPVYEQLTKVYTDSLSKLYTRELQDFMETAKQKLTLRLEKSKHSSGTLHSKLSGSSTSLSKPGELRGRSASMQSVDSGSLGYGSETDLASRSLFDQVLEKMLTELERVCVAEQDFCFKFFHLVEKSAGEAKEGEEGEDVWTPRSAANATEEYFMENLGEGLLQRRTTSEMRQINDAVRAMMSALFPTLEGCLDNFITFCDRQDGLYSMYMLVRMSQHVINAQNTGSFLSKTFGNCLVKVKRSFDKYIMSQIHAVEEAKVSKKSRCGIISFVHHFEEFASLAEAIFKGSDRHADLDKAYAKLVATIFTQIERVAAEHQKTPSEVVMMENFHRMHSILSQMKVACLEGEKRDAKQRYQDHQAAYTTKLLGRPLEKLHVFFEGVQNRVSQGVKPEEVGFQVAFSKQELRKVIKEYPAKEVKKNLEHLYKKVEKHLCEEENLLQVVWHEMQNEFLKQYEHYDKLMQQCYPGSQISLEFSIQDVLTFFGDIAKSH